MTREIDQETVPDPEYKSVIMTIHLDRRGYGDDYRTEFPLKVPHYFDDLDIRFILRQMQWIFDKYLEYKDQPKHTKSNS